jgi:hypothetical protein
MGFRGTDMSAGNEEKQDETLSLTRQIVKEGEILAAKRETPISGLLAQETEFPVARKTPMRVPSLRPWRFSIRVSIWAGRLPAGMNYTSG